MFNILARILNQILDKLNSATTAFLQPQYVDAGNTKVYTSADGITQYVGTWATTRSAGIVRQLVVLASTEASGLGGTFVFEYSEDGINATISETRMITDFATVRDFDLINAGEYFRVKFTPSRTVVGGEMVFINTTFRTQNDGAFVRLANQEIEEQNAALPQTFAYQKSFGLDGKSRNSRASAVSLYNNSETLLASGATFTGTGEEVLDWKSITCIVASDMTGTITIQFAKNMADFSDATLISTVNRTYTANSSAQGLVFTPIGKYYRIKYLNTGLSTQTYFRLQTIVHSTVVGTILAPINTPLSPTSLAQTVVSVPNDGAKTTYRAAFTAINADTSATDLITLTGSDTKTARITKLRMSGTRTASGQNVIKLLKRSTANSGGTFTTPTVVPNDSNNTAATATLRAYTGNPTTGTLVGDILSRILFLPAAGTGADGGQFEADYSSIGQSTVLRGANQVLAINLNGVSIAGATFYGFIEWTEE